MAWQAPPSSVGYLLFTCTLVIRDAYIGADKDFIVVELCCIYAA